MQPSHTFQYPKVTPVAASPAAPSKPAAGPDAGKPTGERPASR